MRSTRSRRTAVIASLIGLAALVLSGQAFAQQITYYDFDTPQANPDQASFQCSGATAPAGVLFCFNDATGQDASPSFLSDTYPAIIDPVATDNPPVSSTHYAVQMTSPQFNQGSSMWFAVPQKVASGFTSYFAFKFTPNANSYATADGIAFVVQNAAGGGSSPDCSPTGSGLGIVGGEGGCIGYGGVDNSVAIEFDTYQNSWDPIDIPGSLNDNHIAIQNCGAGLPNSPVHNGSDGFPSCLVNLNVSGTQLPAIIDPPGITLADGNVHQVVVEYSGPNEATPYLLQIFIDPTFVAGTHTPVPGSTAVLSGIYNLGANLNLINSGSANDSAYVGFTSATGGAFEQHELMAWTFTPHTTVTQEQPISPPGTPTVFPFGTHVYAVTYPPDAPPATGIDMVVTANAVSPQLFSQLVANGPFTGSQCFVYDSTGGNCIVYAVSCINTATNTFTQCPPAPDSSDPIFLKTAFDNSTQPISPGFIQGDPFYGQLTSISGDGTTATVTCTGECSVIPNQTITVVGTSIAGFNGTVTVLAANPSTPNIFTFASSTSGTATGGYITSNNQQNIFVSYSTQRIDGSISGKTLNFSGFVATSVTNAPTFLTIAAPSAAYGTTAVVTVTATSGFGIPTGNMQLSVDGGTPVTSPLSTTGTAVFDLTGLAPGTHTLAVSYPQTGSFQPNTANGTLTVTGVAPIATVTPSSIDFGTLYTGQIGLKTVTVTNTGTAPMTMNTPFLFDVGNGDSNEFIALNLCPGTLGIGRSCTIFVFFYAGPKYNQQTAILKVVDNAPGSPQSVNLSATVIDPQASFSPSSARFGAQAVGTGSQTSVTVTNTGATPLMITGMSITGSNPGDFSASNGCPPSLNPGGKCSIGVTFTPSHTGSRSANLNVMDNALGGSQFIALSGTGK